MKDLKVAHENNWLVAALRSVLGNGYASHIGEVFRYLVVGLANTGIGYGVIFGCMYILSLSPEISNAIGYAVGLVASYFLHRHFTFRSSGRRQMEFVRFIIAFAIAYLMNLASLIIMVRIISMNAGVSQILAGAVYVACAYILNKCYVFGAYR